MGLRMQVAVLALLLGLNASGQANSNQDSGTATATAASSQAAGPQSPEYLIGTDDVLAITVWKEPDLSRVVTVRPDGRITLPLIGDVSVRGLTTKQLQDLLNKKFEAYVADPASTVSVQSSRSQKFDIVGEVQKPGAYFITTPVTVLDAISIAGGFREWAKQKKIYVLRKDSDGKSERLRFNYKDVIKGQHLEENIQLRAGDTVVVP